MWNTKFFITPLRIKETFTNLFKRQLVHLELTQQSPSQCLSSSHDNLKHLSRHCTSPPGRVQHLDSHSWPGLHSFVLASTTRLCKIINDLNNMTSILEYEWLDVLVRLDVFCTEWRPHAMTSFKRYSIERHVWRWDALCLIIIIGLYWSGVCHTGKVCYARFSCLHLYNLA